MVCFLLPGLVSTVHAAQGHDHADRCNYSGETHIHESKLDCDLGDLHVVKVDFYLFAKGYSLSIQEEFKLKIDIPRSFYTRSLERSKSRGPPVC